MAIPAFAPAKDVTGWGAFMETQAWLDQDNGHIEAWTPTWSKNWALGFHGSEGLVVLGEGDRPLGHITEVHTWGVDALSVFWKRSSHTEPWSHDIDPGLAKKVTKMVIIQTHNPKPQLENIHRDVSQYTKTIAQFCTANPQLCTAVGGLI
jgi:hypothetical protein